MLGMLEKLLFKNVEIAHRGPKLNLTTSKNLGGIGAILMFITPLLSFAGVFGSLLGIIGFILVLIALKGLADYYNENGIFNNALYGFVLGIVGSVVSVGVFVGTALTVIADLGISDWTNPNDWVTTFTAEAALDSLLTLLGAIVIALVILFIFIILMAWFYKKSLNLLSDKSGVGMFNTAGLILLIGAFLTIIIIGFLLLWIAIILLAVAFFSLKTTDKPVAETAPPVPPP